MSECQNVTVILWKVLVRNVRMSELWTKCQNVGLSELWKLWKLSTEGKVWGPVRNVRLSETFEDLCVKKGDWKVWGKVWGCGKVWGLWKNKLSNEGNERSKGQCEMSDCQNCETFEDLCVKRLRTRIWRFVWIKMVKKSWKTPIFVLNLKPLAPFLTKSSIIVAKTSQNCARTRFKMSKAQNNYWPPKQATFPNTSKIRMSNKSVT